jgi:hypothetical protein
MLYRCSCICQANYTMLQISYFYFYSTATTIHYYIKNEALRTESLKIKLEPSELSSH